MNVLESKKQAKERAIQKNKGIYSSYERSRLSVSKLLTKSGIESFRGNYMLMQGLIMAKGKGYIYIATSCGYWRLKVKNAFNYELYTEQAFIVYIYPSFHGMVIHGHQLKPGEYNKVIEQLQPVMELMRGIVANKIQQFKKNYLNKKQRMQNERNAHKPIDTT